MKRDLLFTIVILLFSLHTYSQDSWVRIYQPTGWNITSYTKVRISEYEKINFIQHNSSFNTLSPFNGAILKYNKERNVWTIPANNFLSTHCATVIGPPPYNVSCTSVDFFMMSNLDTNFIIKYQFTAGADCPDAKTYITRDAGINYTYNYMFGCGGTVIYPNGGDIDPTNELICYYGFPGFLNFTGQTPAIYKSTNKGSNWFPVDTVEHLRNIGPPQFQNLPGGFIKVNPFNSSYIFAVHKDYMMLSTESGYNFNKINIPPLKELSFDYTENIIYGVTKNKIYKSFNNGLIWDSSDVLFNLNTMEVSPDNNNVIYAGTETGLYRSTNKGLTWYLYNNSLFPSKNIIGLSKEKNTGDTIIVCTSDAVYKVFRGQLVDHNQSNEIVSSFKLYQNYPNPFNPITVISYHLAVASYVSIKVYDVSGHEVAKLVNEKQNAGTYSIKWNAANFQSGIYFYKIEVDGVFREGKKMILLK